MEEGGRFFYSRVGGEGGGVGVFSRGVGGLSGYGFFWGGALGIGVDFCPIRSGGKVLCEVRGVVFSCF